MCTITDTNPLSSSNLIMPADLSDTQGMENYLTNLDRALKHTVHSDRLNTIYETCIRDAFPGMPLRLADFTRSDADQINFAPANEEWKPLIASIKDSLISTGARLKRAELSGSCLDIYSSMVVLLNSQLLELEVLESRSKKGMEETAFKAMQGSVQVTKTMAWTHLITGGAGAALGLGSAVIPNQNWQQALRAAAQNAPTAGQFFTTKQQADLTLSQHEQQVATEKWRSKQEQVKQMREEVRRSLEQLIQKIGEIFQKLHN
ncbi:MAG: hypothetical protein KBC64_00030 [Simkaniaceae bacterium]|nr:hypothetical protein [Simkaniaceae bacterium]